MLAARWARVSTKKAPLADVKRAPTPRACGTQPLHSRSGVSVGAADANRGSDRMGERSPVDAGIPLEVQPDAFTFGRHGVAEALVPGELPPVTLAGRGGNGASAMIPLRYT